MAVCIKCENIFKKKCPHGKVCDDCKLKTVFCVDCGKMIYTSPNGQLVRCTNCRDEYKKSRKKMYQRRWLAKSKVNK